MNIKAGLRIIAILLLAALLLAAAGCRDNSPKEEAVDKIYTSQGGESGESESAESGEENAAPEPEPTPPYDPFQVILDYGGFSEEIKRIILDKVRNDSNMDWIYSIAEMIVAEKWDEADILITTAALLDFAADPVEEFFGNTLFPCGEDIEGGFVVCSNDPQPIEPGEIYLILIKLADTVPTASEDRFYTYAVVFDADGEEENNFQFNPPYDWDFYQNTDLWFMLDYVPSGGWMFNVHGIVSGEYGLPTGTRAVVMGDIIAFFIPASEIATDSPGYRITAFGHDGTFAPEASCGDVTGSNPTEPLLQIEGEPIAVE